MLSYVSPCSRSNAAAAFAPPPYDPSRSRPTHFTPFGMRAFDALDSCGASTSHGPHHEPQTFRTTTEPFHFATSMAAPSRVLPANAGYAGLSSGAAHSRTRSALMDTPLSDSPPSEQPAREANRRVAATVREPLMRRSPPSAGRGRGRARRTPPRRGG